MDSRRSTRGLYGFTAPGACAAQILAHMIKATKDVTKKRLIFSLPAARMTVFLISKMSGLIRYCVPAAAFGRQRFYTQPRLSVLHQLKIIRLSGDWEHGIVSPPGNRDTTEFPHHFLRGGCTSARRTGDQKQT